MAANTKITKHAGKKRQGRESKYKEEVELENYLGRMLKHLLEGAACVEGKLGKMGAIKSYSPVVTKTQNGSHSWCYKPKSRPAKHGRTKAGVTQSGFRVGGRDAL